MNQNKMIDDLIKMLDSGMTKGVGHVNVEVHKNASAAKTVTSSLVSFLYSNPKSLKYSSASPTVTVFTVGDSSSFKSYNKSSFSLCFFPFKM